MGEPGDSNLVARLLARFTGQLYASPAYLAAAGEPAHPAELAAHQCIAFPKNTEWTLQRGQETVTVEVGGRYVLNSVGMIKQLAVLDQGIVQLPVAVVADELASRRLLPLLPGWQGTPVAAYALTETRLLPAKTQRFIEFLRERLAG